MSKTRVYTVHEKGGIEGDVEFVREGFSVWAFIFTFFWLFAHRAWVAGLVAVGIYVVIQAGLIMGELPVLFASAMELVLSIAVGLFAYDLRRDVLHRRGYQETGVAVAGSLEEAELRYFHARADKPTWPVPPTDEDVAFVTA